MRQASRPLCPESVIPGNPTPDPLREVRLSAFLRVWVCILTIAIPDGFRVIRARQSAAVEHSSTLVIPINPSSRRARQKIGRRYRIPSGKEMPDCASGQQQTHHSQYYRVARSMADFFPTDTLQLIARPRSQFDNWFAALDISHAQLITGQRIHYRPAGDLALTDAVLLK